MVLLNFIIASLALVIAVMAYQKAGGDLQEFKRQVGELKGKLTDAMWSKKMTLKNPDRSEYIAGNKCSLDFTGKTFAPKLKEFMPLPAWLEIHS